MTTIVDLWPSFIDQNHSGINLSTARHTLPKLPNKAPSRDINAVQQGAVRRLHRLGFMSGFWFKGRAAVREANRRHQLQTATQPDAMPTARPHHRNGVPGRTSSGRGGSYWVEHGMQAVPTEFRV